MARPRKSDSTRQQLLSTGIALLPAKGYHGTGIKELLDTVGVPKGSFYNFFPSKEAFVVAIIEHYGELEQQEITHHIDDLEGQPALVQIWCAFSRKVWARVAEGESCACLLGAMAAEVAEVSEKCREALAAVEASWIELSAALVAQAQTDGHLTNSLQASELADLIYSSWQGFLLHYQISNDPQHLLKQLWTLLGAFVTADGRQCLENSTEILKPQDFNPHSLSA